MVTDQRTRLPAVDESLVVPEQGYEVIDGQVLAVSPADEPHATRHTKLAALLQAHVAEGWRVAVDMLTRTGQLDEFAPDASVYASARDPVTGGRQLERLAFEVVVSETLGHAGRKATKLLQRGVARVFAIDVDHARVLEWSVATDAWELLLEDGALEDPALAVPLPWAELRTAAGADDAIARALLAKRNRILCEAMDRGREEGREEGRERGRAEGRAEAIVAVLVARGLAPSAAERDRILAATNDATLARWLKLVATCTSVRELLAANSA